MKNTFDARRRNLGKEPPSEAKHWRTRLLAGGACLLLIATLIISGFVWWAMTHVTTTHAAVCAAVVSLAADVDARMAELSVCSGQRVTKGQALARLDDTALRAALAAAEADKAIKESLAAQAQAQRTLVEKKVEAEIALAKTRVEIARGHVAATQASLDLRWTRIPDEIRQAQARRDEASARLTYLKKGARKERIEAARARLATAEARAALAAFQVKQTTALVDRRVESQLELEIVKTDYAAKQNEVREAKLQLAQLLSGPTSDQIEAATQALEAREAALTLARTGEKAARVLAAESAIRKVEVREAEAKLRLAAAQRAQMALAREQVKAAAAELRKAEAEAARCRASLAKMTIVSPVAGTIIRTFDRVGEVCRKAVPTILVADDSAGRWIEGFVSEDDAALVRVGQSAHVEVIIGSGEHVDATVEAVGLSTSAIGRNRTGASEDPAVQSSARMVWVKLRPLGPTENLLPGSTARAVIRVRTGK